MTILQCGCILTKEMHGSAGKLLLGDYTVTKLLQPRKFFHVTLKNREKRINRVVTTEYLSMSNIARLHLIGLLDESAQSDRLIGLATAYNWTDVLAVLHKLCPDVQLPEPPPNEARNLTEVLPSKRAGEFSRSFFGWDWDTMEDSVADGIVVIV